MSDGEIRDQLMTLLVAGHETTATGLAWTLDLLTRHPDVLDRARADGDDATCARSSPSRCGCGRSSRSPAAGSPSTCEADGLDLPAGTDVTPAIWLAHTRPDAYPEPYAFRPERFLERAPAPTRGSRSAAACAAASARRSPRWRCASCSARSCAASTCAPRAAAPSASPAATSLSPPPRHPHHRHPHASWAGIACQRANTPKVVVGPDMDVGGDGRGVPSGARDRSAASSRVAALQVALRAHGVYAGAVDGLAGPGHRGRRAPLPGRQGARRGRHRRPAHASRARRPRPPPVGSRPLRLGHRGWDVAALQFALETHGFPCGRSTAASAPHNRGRRRRQAFPVCPPTASPAPRRAPRSPRPPVRAPALLARSPPRSATATARAAPASTPGSTSPPPPAPR